MVIDAEDIDLRAVYVAVGAWLVGVIVVALLIAIVAARLGRRRFGWVSMVLALVVAVSGLIVALVASRVVTGEATIPDLLWAVVLAAVAMRCVQILREPAVPRDDER